MRCNLSSLRVIHVRGKEVRAKSGPEQNPTPQEATPATFPNVSEYPRVSEPKSYANMSGKRDEHDKGEGQVDGMPVKKELFNLDQEDGPLQ